MSATTEETLSTLCAGCRKPLDSGLPSWQETVNLTPDVLFFEGCAFEVNAPIELDIAFDWCGRECFVRWCFVAAAALQTEPQP